MISFGDGARLAFQQAVKDLRYVGVVALLGDGEEPELDGNVIVPDVDVQIIRGDADGVIYRNVDKFGNYLSTGDEKTKPWEEIARVHVY